MRATGSRIGLGVLVEVAEREEHRRKDASYTDHPREPHHGLRLAEAFLKAVHAERDGGDERTERPLEHRSNLWAETGRNGELLDDRIGPAFCTSKRQKSRAPRDRRRRAALKRAQACLERDD